MKYAVFDIEADGLKPTKIYCLCYTDYEGKKGSITDYEEMKQFFTLYDTYIGHNIIRFDLPVLKRLIGLELDFDVIDTLGLSWYLYPNRKRHGLEYWGSEFNNSKVSIENWFNLPLEEYIKRCERDVEINLTLFLKQYEYLKKIYATRKTDSIIRFLNFNLDCLREQEEIGWKVNQTLLNEHIKTFTNFVNTKEELVRDIMPVSEKFKEVSKPVRYYKKDGSISVAGKIWEELLKSKGLPLDTTESVQVCISSEKGNPVSIDKQVKPWLLSLGWVPETFEYKEGGRKIPQINTKDKNVCKSIRKLYTEYPMLENLEGLYASIHTLNTLKGIKKNLDERGYVEASAAGFTKTMRLKHMNVVNLKKALMPGDDGYGTYKDGGFIRSVLCCEDDELLCGTDMSSLEDNTKQHFIYKYDPEYVKSMRVPGFDPHLDIAVLSGLLTPEQAEEHKKYDKTKGVEGTSYKGIRGKAKTTNFAATYGVGFKKLSLTSKMSEDECKHLLKIYWQRNKAIRDVARSMRVKEVDGSMWIFNPVSKFWYHLSNEKDIFSAINQSLGSFAFVLYLKEIRKRYKICGQFHDEVIIPIKAHQKEELAAYLKECINQVNKTLKLNIELGVSIDFGTDYSQIH